MNTSIKHASNNKKIRALKNTASSLAMAVAGVLVCGPVNAKDVGDYDVWEFENIQATEKREGYVLYSGDRLIGNLVQEDIGRLGHVDLKANLTVATGVEAGPMHILGKLTSTGQVFILDTNGVLFGEGAVVDTAGLAVLGGEAENLNSINIDNRLNVNISENAFIDIQKGAQITVAEAGLAAFVAPQVSNAGVISAKKAKS